MEKIEYEIKSNSPLLEALSKIERKNNGCFSSFSGAFSKWKELILEGVAQGDIKIDKAMFANGFGESYEDDVKVAGKAGANAAIDRYLHNHFGIDGVKAMHDYAKTYEEIWDIIHDSNKFDDFKAYFNTFAEFFQPTPHLQVHFELGRSIVAQCGSLISTVLYVKEGKKRKFVVLDAGMNDLLRPALYQAYHKIENVTSRLPEEKYDVVGPVCESADCFGKDVTLPATRRGDMIAIRSCGAYGEAMASRYNLRDLAPAVYWASDQG